MSVIFLGIIAFGVLAVLLVGAIAVGVLTNVRGDDEDKGKGE